MCWSDLFKCLCISQIKSQIPRYCYLISAQFTVILNAPSPVNRSVFQNVYCKHEIRQFVKFCSTVLGQTQKRCLSSVAGVWTDPNANSYLQWKMRRTRLTTAAFQYKVKSTSSRYSNCTDTGDVYIFTCSLNKCTTMKLFKWICARSFLK